MTKTVSISITVEIDGKNKDGTVPCAHGHYHIFDHLSTDNIVRFLFLNFGVDSKQVKSKMENVKSRKEWERLPCIIR